MGRDRPDRRSKGAGANAEGPHPQGVEAVFVLAGGGEAQRRPRRARPRAIRPGPSSETTGDRRRGTARLRPLTRPKPHGQPERQGQGPTTPPGSGHGRERADAGRRGAGRGGGSKGGWQGWSLPRARRRSAVFEQPATGHGGPVTRVRHAQISRRTSPYRRDLAAASGSGSGYGRSPPPGRRSPPPARASAAPPGAGRPATP